MCYFVNKKKTVERDNKQFKKKTAKKKVGSVYCASGSAERKCVFLRSGKRQTAACFAADGRAARPTSSRTSVRLIFARRFSLAFLRFARINFVSFSYLEKHKPGRNVFLLIY